MAYRLCKYGGYYDNGEYRAGKRLLNILEDRNLQGRAASVARKYRGTPLGQKQFAYIKKVAREALNPLQRTVPEPVTFKVSQITIKLKQLVSDQRQHRNLN